MNHLQSLLRKTLPTSLVPFLIGGSFYLLGGAIPKLASEAYDSYFQFMLTMLFINIVIKISCEAFNSKAKAKSSSFDFSSWTTEMLQEPSKTNFKGVIIAVIQYSIAYGLYCALGLYISSLSCGSLVQCLGLPLESKVPQSLSFSRVLSEEVAEQQPSKLLEEVGEFSVLTPARQRELNSLSLSVGRVLSSLSIDAVSIALSSDGRIAYVSTRDRVLKIIDVSNLNAPSVITTITLGQVNFAFLRKELYLSPDGTTLFASTFQTLEIIDVTDPTAPVLLSTIKDSTLDDGSSGAPVYKISMAFSDDQDTLYVAGLGLQIFHVADLSAPLIIKHGAKEGQKFADLVVTSLAFDEDEEILYYADGTLKVFDCSEPTNLKQIGTYSSIEYIHSVASPDGTKSIYVTGSNGKDTILEKLNVTSPRNIAKINSFVLDLNVDDGVLPMIISVNSEESHAFLVAGSQSYATSLFVFNLLKGKLLDNTKSLLPKAKSLYFLKESNSIIAGYDEHFVTLGLYLDYPNSRTYYLSNTTTATFQPEGTKTFILSPDGKTVWTMETTSSWKSTSQGSLEIFDVSDTSAPSRVVSTTMAYPCAPIKISFEAQRAIFPYTEAFKVYDISNKKSLSLVGTIQLDSSQTIQDWVISSDAKVGYVLLGSSGDVTLKIFDFSKLVEIPNELNPKGDTNTRVILSKDNKSLFILGPKLLVYDVSDLSNIKLLSDGEIGADEPGVRSCEISADSKMLLITTLESANVNILRIFSVNEPHFPVLLSELTLPQLGYEGSLISPVISTDSKLVSIFEGEGVLQIDISSPQFPKVIGLVPIFDSKDKKYEDFKMTQDGKTAFAVYSDRQVKVIDLQPKFSVFLNQESFPVGQKYSDSLAVFALNKTSNEYFPLDKQEFRFIKNSLHDIKINPSQMNTQQSFSQLPSWISIDRENNIATIEPKRSRDIGSYTIYTAFSRKIPLKAFSEIDNRIEYPEDLVTLLIALDYIDPQLFVTKNFGALQDFFLNKDFSPYKTQIYNLLKQYLVETCTTFDVAPSLSFIASERMLIDTPSTSNIKFDIKLKAEEGAARFLRKTYGSVEPVIFEDKTRMTLEGPLKEINLAIQQLAVDLNNTESCDGTITITDNLNPSIVKYIPNVSNYFRINLAPVRNVLGASDVQVQVERQIIETGKYFVFELEQNTFVDEHTKSLTYSLTMQDTRKAMPSWLTLEGTTFKGTPPEELFGRTIDLILHVSNEFKELQAPFKLSTRVSSTYLFKLLIKLSPYGLTVLGLLISANKIYNVVYKKKYRHAKEFYVKVGEEITSEVIFPVVFIQEEKGESERILSHLQKKVAKELHKRSISSLELAQHFINPSTRELDKPNIMRVINEVVSGLKESEQRTFKVYFNGAASRKLLVNQIVINQLTTWLLEADQATKNTFERIKGEWSNIVEWTASGNFATNELKLESVLRGDKDMAEPLQAVDSEANQRLLGAESGVNKDLLKNAIAGYALECQSLDMLAIRVHILAKEKVGNDRIKGYLKMDLEEINFNERGRADYGIDYKIKNSALCFSGVVQEDFKGKTIVIQLTSLKHKILKEIWISEESCKLGVDALGNQMIPGHEEIARGQNYEVY